MTPRDEIARELNGGRWAGYCRPQQAFGDGCVMNDKTRLSWHQWWSTHPWRRQRWMPAGMSTEERSEWLAQRAREHYATHRSARLARWGILLGLMICVAGFFVSMAYSRAVSDLGYGLELLGIAVAVIALFFTATVRG